MDDKELADFRRALERERAILDRARQELGDLHTPRRVTPTSSMGTATPPTRNTRGFRVFARWDHRGPSLNQHGLYTYSVSESSIALCGPHVWLDCRPNETASHDCGPYSGSMHLSLDDARLMRDALDRFIAESEGEQLTESPHTETTDGEEDEDGEDDA